jgi:hypothetical protein
MIRSDIIWKKINNTLSKEEEVEFSKWIEKKEHQLYYNKALKYFKNGSDFNNDKINIESKWENFESRLIDSRLISKFSSKFITAAAASVTLLIISTLFFLNSQQNNSPLISEAVVQPGKSKARLILDGGESYELSQNNNFNISSGVIQISNEASKISYSKERSNNKAALSKETYHTLEVPRGGEYFIELSDGTKIWINSDSKLKYPVEFIGQSRNIELIGEAYFEVAHNSDKSFIVTSGTQRVEVLGTSFNISSYELDDFIMTTLIEGQVKVKNSLNEQNSAYLKPNQQSILDKKTGLIESKEVKVDEYVAWQSGWFRFNDKPISQIMVTLARWYDLEVVFENENTANKHFSGGFKRYDSFDQARKIIEQTGEINFKVEGKKAIIF